MCEHEICEVCGSDNCDKSDRTATGIYICLECRLQNDDLYLLYESNSELLRCEVCDKHFVGKVKVSCSEQDKSEICEGCKAKYNKDKPSTIKWEYDYEKFNKFAEEFRRNLSDIWGI